MTTDFPTVAHLRAGARLYTVATAVWAAGEDDPNLLEGWDGDTYLRNNGSGDAAAITFRGDRVVGGFFAHESPRSPYNPATGGEYDWRERFEGAPDELVALAESEALQYLLQDVDGGEVMPVITTAFWNAGERMTSCDEWSSFGHHGGFLLDVECLSASQGIDACAEYYGLPPERLDLLRELHAQRESGPFTLSSAQRKRLLGRKRRDEEAEQLLAAAGITM